MNHKRHLCAVLYFSLLLFPFCEDDIEIKYTRCKTSTFRNADSVGYMMKLVDYQLASDKGLKSGKASMYICMDSTGALVKIVSNCVNYPLEKGSYVIPDKCDNPLNEYLEVASNSFSDSLYKDLPVFLANLFHPQE